jgi:tetratricopeptide (TPR) repeat protein
MTCTDTASGRRPGESLLLAGLVHLTLGDREAALEAFEKARGGAEGSWLASLCAAEILIDRRDYREAAELLAEQIGRTPELAEAHYLLGLAYQRVYRNSDAIRCFRTALVLEPAHRRAAAGLAELIDVQEP